MRKSPGQSLRAVVASRLSRVHDNATGDESQLLNAHEYVAARGWTVVGEASDLDVSAIKVDPWKRPELSYWLNNPHLFDALVFRSIDRLARKMFDFMDLLRWADTNNIRMVCLDLGDGIDFSTPEGKMVSLGLAYAAEIEGNKITSRVLGARKHMRRVGRWGAGRAPYGYQLCEHPTGVGHALEPHPERHAIVLEIAERFLKGESRNAIAADLNRRGVPSPLAETVSEKSLEKRGGKTPRWSARGISFILGNEGTRGRIVHKGKLVRHQDGPAAGKPMTYGPPLIDAVTWRKLQARLSETTYTREGRSTEQDPADASPLLGVLFCGHCGERMYRSEYIRRYNVKGPDGNPLPKETKKTLYRCVSKRAKGTDCEGQQITGEHVEAWTETEFLKRVGSMSTVILEHDPGHSNAADLAEVEDALTELREDRAAGLYRGERGTAEFRTMYAELEARREALEAEPTRPASVRVVETGISYDHEWEFADAAQRRKLLQDAGVKVSVVRGPGRGFRNWQDRLTFEMTGAGRLHDQGHDDANAAGHRA